MRIQRFIPTVLVGVVAMLAFASAPALAAAPETPVTVNATEVTGNSAVLHGELNPHAPGENGQEYQFLYALSGSRCRIPGETEYLPEPPAVSLGNEKEAVSIEATNLMPDTTYAFCLLEEHEGEEIQGTPLTFKTLATAKPFIYKDETPATEVGTFSATLNASINTEKEETTYLFEYATNEAMTGAQTVAGKGPLPAQEFPGQPIPASVSTGSVLAAGTTYYFRVLATNPTGTTTGPVEQFTTVATQEKPTVVSESFSAHNSYEPKLEASIDPNFEETSYSFQYSTEESGGVLTGTIHTLPGAPPAKLLPAVSEEAGLPTSPVGMPGLQPGVTYYYRVVANDKTSEEAHEPAYGPVQSFQADGSPAITIAAAGETTRTSADVSGTVTAQGLASTYHFEYIPLASYEAAVADGAADPYAASLGGRDTYDTKLSYLEEGHELSFEDYVAHPVEATLEELAPETTYVYALVAHNELGSRTGAQQTFTTQARTAPVAVTGGASGVGQTAATLSGAVDTRGLQSTVQFEFGTSATPGANPLVPAVVVPGSEAGTAESIEAALGGNLQPGTTYYYRALATNQDGTGYGALLSFTTPGFPAAFPAAALTPAIPYTPIAQLDAKEAKEGKAVNPKKKAKGKKKRGKKGRHKHKKKK